MSLTRKEGLGSYTLEDLPGEIDCAPNVGVSHSVWINAEVEYHRVVALEDEARRKYGKSG